MEILLTKGRGGALYPADELEAEKIERFALGEIIKAEVTVPRNSMFHRKFMKMLRVGFDAFEPAVREYKGFAVQKEFEQFREDAADTTPRIRLAVEMIPSFAPSTAARSHPMRSTRWLSM